MTNYGFNPYTTSISMNGHVNVSPGYNNEYNPYAGYGVPPINNMTPMGGGYSFMRQNYYGGYNYMNPFLMQQLRNKEIEDQKRDVEERRQRAIALSKCVNADMSPEELEEHLKIYDPKNEEEEFEKYLKQKKYDSLKNSIKKDDHPYYKYEHQCMMSRETVVSNQYRKYETPQSNMWEDLENTGSIRRDIYEEEMKLEKRNMSNLYDQSKYNSLLNSQSPQSSYFSTMYNAVSVDDMEITPPNSISTPEYMERRNKFIQSILGGSNE